MATQLEDLALNLESLQDTLCGLARLLAGHDGTEGARSQIEWSASHLFMAIQELLQHYSHDGINVDKAADKPVWPGQSDHILKAFDGLIVLSKPVMKK